MVVLFLLYVFISIQLTNGCNNRDPVTHDRRAAHGGNARVLKVLSYNAEWAFTNGCTAWAEFPDANQYGQVNHVRAWATANGNAMLDQHITDIGTYIQQENADIVLIMEVCDCGSLTAINAAVDAANGATFGYLPWIPPHQGAGMKVGALTRIDPPDVVGNILPYLNGFRGLQMIVPIWGQNFYIYGVHFHAQAGTRARDTDARELQAAYHAHLPYVIVGGDFNG
eukprot:179766_1